MRFVLTLIFTTLGMPALAHVGHLGEVAGHSHWIALGAIILAGAVAAWGAKGRKDKDAEPEEEIEGEEEPA